MITNTILWNHRGRVGADGKGQIEVRITVDRKSYYFGTGIRCLQSEFAAGQVVNCPGADELNKRLAIIYSKVLACVNACVNNNVEINVEDIRREVWKTVEAHSDEPTFLNWIGEQIPLLSVSEGTRRHYDPLQTRLEAFGKLRQWQDVTVENIVAGAKKALALK